MRSQLEKEFSFHIPQKNQPYFEGWYVRIHTNSLDFAVIFGLSLSTKKDVFIQYLDSHCSKVYHYSWHELTFTIEPFCIQIAGNHLSLDQLKLALPEIKATLDFDQLIPLKISRYAPTIMGPFAYFPMECIHSRNICWGNTDIHMVDLKIIISSKKYKSQYKTGFVHKK